MDKTSGKLTVFFEEPFWVGVFELISNGKLSVCKVTFGAEPKDYEIWEFVLNRYSDLKFSRAVEIELKHTADNPKRRQRNAKKQLQSFGLGTKSQQALQIQREEMKTERKHNSKEQKEAEKKRQFALQQHKRKEKHSESSAIYRYEFQWDINEHLFIMNDRGDITKKEHGLRPSDEYLNKILDDKQQLCQKFTEYYVLPELIPEGTEFFDTNVGKIEVKTIIDAIQNEKVIRITGGSGYGKSSLLKYLYAETINSGYLPLFIEKRDYTDSRIEKMFRDMFELQYGNVPQGYSKYDQYTKNAFAYFVAKHVNRKLEKDPTDQEKLIYIMEHICFGINDTIILFLSFIRNNTKIILQIASKAEELVSDFPEWDFDTNNLPFLTCSSSLSNDIPSAEDRKEAKKSTSFVEKNRQEAIKFRGIFDFSEEDVNKKRYKILRALKYTQIVGRALIDQYGSLDTNEIDAMLKTLFSVPQKIIYATLEPYQINHEEVVKDILEFAKKEIPDVKITEEDINQMLEQAGIVLSLNIMNDISYNASNNQTIVALEEMEMKNSNYKIMRLMMNENAGNTVDFVSKAVKLKDDLKNNSFAGMLISQIARKHMIYSDRIDHKQLDKLVSSGIFSPKGKKSLLLEQGSGKKKKN